MIYFCKSYFKFLIMAEMLYLEPSKDFIQKIIKIYLIVHAYILHLSITHRKHNGAAQTIDNAYLMSHDTQK